MTALCLLSASVVIMYHGTGRRAARRPSRGRGKWPSSPGGAQTSLRSPVTSTSQSMVKLDSDMLGRYIFIELVLRESGQINMSSEL